MVWVDSGSLLISRICYQEGRQRSDLNTVWSVSQYYLPTQRPLIGNVQTQLFKKGFRVVCRCFVPWWCWKSIIVMEAFGHCLKAQNIRCSPNKTGDLKRIGTWSKSLPYENSGLSFLLASTSHPPWALVIFKNFGKRYCWFVGAVHDECVSNKALFLVILFIGLDTYYTVTSGPYVGSIPSRVYRQPLSALVFIPCITLRGVNVPHTVWLGHTVGHAFNANTLY